MRKLLFLGVLVVGLSSLRAAEGDGETQILKWKDGKRACILLGFDDSAPSQLQYVVPALIKRKMVGTFYLVPGGGVHARNKARWEEAAKSPYVVVANHTWTHKGVLNAEELEPELAKCNEVLYGLLPEGRQSRLLAFGRPGGVPWIVSKEDFQAALARHHLADRPPFAGPPINYKSAEATVAVVDEAIAKGEMRQLVFHGVGGDWLVTPVEWFTALLDKLQAEQERVWVTDAASWHKYVQERDGTKVEVVVAEEGRVRLKLTGTTDPALYDEPLSLATRVPSDWKQCVVRQGEVRTRAEVGDGVVQYAALPGGGEVVLEKVE